ncbi:hypothetical protein ACLBWX_08325 [Methylobacterium sp. M6A4_1b]
MHTNRLAETEAGLARADQAWRFEVTRRHGPDGVLHFGYSPEGRGEEGSPMRQAYEARRQAVALWRHERRAGG